MESLSPTGLQESVEPTFDETTYQMDVAKELLIHLRNSLAPVLQVHLRTMLSCDSIDDSFSRVF